MLSSATPTLVPLAFAANGTKNTIPEASQISVTPGAASLNDGFPPLTFTPIAAGGVPPAGADFNGVLNLITQTIRWKQAGGQFAYNAAFATDPNVGGYPKGAVLIKATLTGLWMSTADNNTTNPDTGGAGWVDLTAGRLLRTTIYTNVGGTVMMSVDGATPIAQNTFTSHPLATFREDEGCGGGGPGGGAFATTSGSLSTASGGASATYAKGRFTTPLSAAPVAVGAGGAGVSGGVGTAGGTTSLATEMTCPGGGPGGTATAATGAFTQSVQGAIGAAPTGGNIVSSRGQPGYNGNILGTLAVPGLGAPGPWGGGGQNGTSAVPVAANNGTGPGAGGGGIGNGPSQPSFTGPSGAGGILIIREFS